jgi:hypothetical protein
MTVTQLSGARDTTMEAAFPNTSRLITFNHWTQPALRQ